MEEYICKDLQMVIEKTIDILKVKEPKDVEELAELSDYAIQNASTCQDEGSVDIAILIYTFYKILKTNNLERIKNWQQIYKGWTSKLTRANQFLNQKKYDQYHAIIKDIFKDLSKIDKKINTYTEHIINAAKIKKGSKLFSHGISTGRAAQITGTTRWQLQNYVAKTKLPEQFGKEFHTATWRLKHAKKIFGLK